MGTPPRTPADLDQAATDLVEAWTAFSDTCSRFPGLAEEKFGLSRNRLHALYAIDHGAVRVQDVADQTWTSVSATSRTIDALVREGYLDRSPDPADRRAALLSLTPPGKDLVAEVEEWRGRFMAAVTEALGPDRTRAVIRALEDVDAAIIAAVEELRS